MELPFDGGPAEEALRTQTVQVVAPAPRGSRRERAHRWVVLAPVTERGEALGLLQLSLPERARRGGAVPDRPDRARAGVRGDRQPPTHRPVRVGAAQHLVHAARGDPAPAAAGRVHLRGRGLRPLGVAGTGGLRRRRHLRLQPGPRRAAPVGDRRDGPRRGQRPDRHLVRRQPAQHPPRGRLPARAGDAANRALHEHAVHHRHRRASRPACWGAWTCAPARWRWSTPATSPPTCAAPEPSRRSALPVDLPAGHVPRHAPTAAPTSSSSPATGSCWSPTACSSATPPPWT